MGRFLVLFFIALAVIEAVAAASNLKWVSASNGKVPAYAVAGGSDFPGEVLYAARIKLSSGLTPGKMDVSSKLAHASWGGKEHYNSNYEILTNPGWKSHLEWKKSSGKSVPANAVLGGHDNGKPVYVARFLYSDGHMIPGKASYVQGLAHVGYGCKEYFEKEWWVLVEHSRQPKLQRRHMIGNKRGFAYRPPFGKREFPSRFEYPDLPGVKPMKRAPVIDQ